MKAVADGLSLHILGALSAVGWLFLCACSHRETDLLRAFGFTLAWEWLVFATGLWLVRRSRSTFRIAPIFAWAIAFRICGLLAVPVFDDDYFRFLWDGRQFALTGNPYAAPPAAYFNDRNLPERFAAILDQVNYPSVPTIYGPVCQAGFALSYFIAPGELWPWKLLLIAVELGVLAMLVALARGPFDARAPAGRGPASRNVLLAVCIFGWCPLAVFETSFNAHPDVVGIVWVLAALLPPIQRRPLVCGAICALGVPSKVFTLLLVPFLLDRSKKAWLAFAMAVIALYAPFWMQGSSADLAGLRAFAEDWEFNSSIYALLRLGLGPGVAKVLCGIAFAMVWLFLFHRWRTLTVKQGEGSRYPPGAALFGAFFLLSPTVNPWYLLWLAPFAALRPRWDVISALAFVSLSYVTGLNLGDSTLGNFEHPGWVRPLEYGGIALVAAICYLQAGPCRLNADVDESGGADNAGHPVHDD